ncbi:MAG: DUF2167 domain-containing protein [Sphingomonas sp.]|uniref:DUF2167 domain-containing protein n=1 Tax=Sphingomonas sp. TaxID=28214 RepID=UPI001B07B3F4|nr:DUF2167 domain-containing protein [Sphingomonas sp.]MBO9624042.1 DUF2167 domain-containing protein [Sphingomonas sp.]
MRRLWLAGAVALATALACDGGIALAKEGSAASAGKGAEAKLSPAAEQFLKSLHPRTGDVVIPEAKAVMHLGDRYYFLPAADARRVLVEVWRNPPDAVSDVLGLVLEKDSTAFQNVWGAVITYQDSGHVSDADANKQDYDGVLADMRKGEAEENQQRKTAGYPELTLVGWAQPPAYDAANHALIWARELAEGGAPEHGLNYDVRLLGRTGVLSLNMVSGMSSIAEVRGAAQDFGKAVSFQPGAAYADFNASTDRSAEYGLAGLVAGGAAVAVAKKVGLLAILLKFGKVILIGLAAAGAAVVGFFKRLFGRGGEEEAI